MESYLRSQEELVEKFDSGFSGYRGLSGKFPAYLNADLEFWFHSTLQFIFH